MVNEMAEIFMRIGFPDICEINSVCVSEIKWSDVEVRYDIYRLNALNWKIKCSEWI